MQDALQLSIETLEWAAHKAGSSLDDFARTLYAKEETVESITRGQLTLAQIRKFSERAKVPFGFLFLPKPPEDYRPDHNLADFRTVQNKRDFSQDLIDVFKDVEHKQSWYRDYLLGIDAPSRNFVGKFRDKNTSVKEIAADIRSTIKLDNIEKSIKTAEDYYSAISHRCEEAGILVFKNSVVVNSTKRKLNAEEFRGFVIADEYAPAIFINGDDTKYANIFTLAHELAHIWLGESGVSDVAVSSNNKEEVKCNAIAAEVLVPSSHFLRHWDTLGALGAREKISAINKAFKVSELVAARVALTNEKISQATYSQIHAEIVQRWRDKKQKDKEKEAKIPPAITLPVRNSRLITKTVLSLVNSQRMGPSEAAILLNTSAARIFAL